MLVAGIINGWYRAPAEREEVTLWYDSSRREKNALPLHTIRFRKLFAPFERAQQRRNVQDFGKKDPGLALSVRKEP
jgi:hypothetical protein